MNLFSNRVLVTLTSEVGKIISKLHQVKPNGCIDLIRGIKVANVSIFICIYIIYIHKLNQLTYFYSNS